MKLPRLLRARRGPKPYAPVEAAAASAEESRGTCLGEVASGPPAPPTTPDTDTTVPAQGDGRNVAAGVHHMAPIQERISDPDCPFAADSRHECKRRDGRLLYTPDDTCFDGAVQTGLNIVNRALGDLYAQAATAVPRIETRSAARIRAGDLVQVRFVNDCGGIDLGWLEVVSTAVDIAGRRVVLGFAGGVCCWVDPMRLFETVPA